MVPPSSRWSPAILVATLLLLPAATHADVELRWETFESARAVDIARGIDEASLAPIARVDGGATSFRDETPPESPRLCYRVRALDAEDQTLDEHIHCLTRPPAVSGAPPEDALPGQEPTRWRGLEGWYQVVPVPAQVPAAATAQVPAP